MGNQKGALTVPLAFGLMIAAFLGIGFLSLLHQSRHRVSLQLRLDKCVAATSLQLTHWVREIDSSGRRMTGLRAALAGAAALRPEAITVLRLALQAEALHQQAVLVQWRARQALWLVRTGCDGKFDLAPALPSAPWRQDPPDALGPRPFRWLPETAQEFHVQLGKGPVTSAAVIKGGVRDVQHRGPEKWRAEWARPIGTGFR